MNKLIIITGISGTGKTTLANALYKKIEDSTLLSYDKVYENISDIVGFKDKKEKKSVRAIGTKIYKMLVEKCMKRGDSIIILEKPFKEKWQNFFKKLSQKYEYEIYTINIFAKDFETIWNRLLKREMAKADRHPAHYLDSYSFKKKEDYEPFFEFKLNALKREYNKLISNSINLGKIIEVQDIEKLDIDKLIKSKLKIKI